MGISQIRGDYIKFIQELYGDYIGMYRDIQGFGFPKLGLPFCVFPYEKGYGILGSILGSPYLGNPEAA